MRSRSRAVALALAALMGAAGCGGDDRGDKEAKPPDDAARKASFVTRADAVCTKFAERTAQEPEAQTRRGPARQVTETRETAAATLDELRRLDPPKADRQILDRYFASSRARCAISCRASSVRSKAGARRRQRSSSRRCGPGARRPDGSRGSTASGPAGGPARHGARAPEPDRRTRGGGPSSGLGASGERHRHAPPRHHAAASLASTRRPHVRLATSSPRAIARRTDRAATEGDIAGSCEGPSGTQ